MYSDQNLGQDPGLVRQGHSYRDRAGNEKACESLK
ncbi:MAG: hypothetical protein JW384_01358 [Nitrosomonadaceae bacterium]|nr:hypothetical protein [Nitrosomonadaceae bacterium]